MKTTLPLAFACVAFLTALSAAAQQPSQAPDPQLQQGISLDLQGNYEEARTHIKRAIDTATTPDAASRATRALAVSYAFESKCTEAAAAEAPLYETALGAKAFNDAGELANELARICLESGDAAQAEAWYRKGFEAGKQDTTNQNSGPELWTFRWEHAQAHGKAQEPEPEVENSQLHAGAKDGVAH